MRFFNVFLLLFKVIFYRDPQQMFAEQAQKLRENIDPDGILLNAVEYIKLPSSDYTSPFVTLKYLSE